MRARYQIINHRIEAARQYSSPHTSPRSGGEVSLIVLHCISLPAGHFGGRYVEDLFMGTLSGQAHQDFSDLTAARVSAHLLIRRCGALLQFVAFDRLLGMRAYHSTKVGKGVMILVSGSSLKARIPRPIARFNTRYWDPSFRPCKTITRCQRALWLGTWILHPGEKRIRVRLSNGKNSGIAANLPQTL